MEFRVQLYETETGEKPVAVFLNSLEGRNPDLHRLVTAGLRKLKYRDYHGPPLTKALHGAIGVFELRVGNRDIARVFFFYGTEREIICTNGYVKKAQKLDTEEVARAERFKKDWEQRRF